MKKSILTLFIFSFIILNVCYSQSSIESVLLSIEKNNKEIAATKQLGLALNYEYKTGLSPEDPLIGFDYLFGNPSSIGNQTQLSVIQILDFPTAYSKKSQLSKLRIKQTDHQVSGKRQDILHEAKKICIELIYANKLQQQLTIQKENTEKLLEDFKKNLESGNGNILDVNKAQLALIEVNKESLQNTSFINQLNEKLTEMNGGVSMTFTGTEYPVIPGDIIFTQLEEEYEKNDHNRKYLEQQVTVARKQVEVTKALSLPQLAIGYYYQDNLGQTLQGIQTGISIPLWENNNKTEMQKARLMYADLELKSHLNEHYFEIKQLHEQYLSLKEIAAQYRSALDLYNNQSLLDKSLSAGQISVIEYFLELNFYYDAFENYLETERDLNVIVAELYKYKL